MRGRRGFTLVEVLVVVTIIALLVAILLPSLARARELAKRAVCAANLKGFGTGMRVYAERSIGRFPIVAHHETDSAYGGTAGNVLAGGAGQVDPGLGLKGSANADWACDEAAEHNFKAGPDGDRQVSTTACLWLLVRDGDMAPAQFHCPSSDDEKDRTEQTTCYYDFTGYNTVSYGYQVPFNDELNPAQPHVGLDVRVPVAADKGPYVEAGAAWGTSPSGQTGLQAKTATKPPPAQYPSGEDAARHDAYAPWNSPNHGGIGFGAGQNVLFPDAHAEWADTPVVGVDGDSIYTAGPTRRTMAGAAPKNSPLPGSELDALIYP